MPTPKLTFFCELDVASLQALFSNPAVIQALQALKAGVSLGIVDQEPARAEVVQRLNTAGIPVSAWLLLKVEQGYYAGLDNARQMQACYQEFQAWTAANELEWAAVGLDIEPDLRDIQAFEQNPWSMAPIFLRRLLPRRGLSHAEAIYRRLVDKIRADGYRVESYQFPVIIDERKAGTTLLRRLTGLVDVTVDREVWMLYTRFSLNLGVGYLWNYAAEAQSIAVGSTGGGITPAEDGPQPLDWDELSRDLRLAWHYTDSLYIFSLEGCVRQGFLERLKTFAWDVPIIFPEAQAEVFTAWRSALQSSLWLSRHLGKILASTAAAWWLVAWLRRKFGSSLP